MERNPKRSATVTSDDSCEEPSCHNIETSINCEAQRSLEDDLGEDPGDVLNYEISEDEDMCENRESNSETCEKTFPNSGSNESLDLG